MLPSSDSAVWAILLAIVPGYVAASTWARSRTWKGHPSDLRLVLQSLWLSALIQLALAPLTLTLLYPYRHDLTTHPRRLVLWGILAVVVVPVVGGVIAARIGDWMGTSGITAVEGKFRQWVSRWVWRACAPPSIWDAVFELRPPDECFVIVQYTDGHRVAGVYAGGSLALTSPEPHELFLQPEWLLDQDGNLTEPVLGSAGIMIQASDTIRTVRLIHGDPVDEEGADDGAAIPT